MSVIIAGERSGVGKTTITLAILAFLRTRNAKVQSFKVGPDYIDPMFHTKITSLPCRNLDPVLTSPQYINSCFSHHANNRDYVLIEGVMGLFDGINLEGVKDYASTAHIARILNLPVILVLDCARLSGSIAAMAKGYIEFDPQVKIVGLILNRVGSDRHLELLQDALEPLGIAILGVLRRQDNITIPDRHLGLVPSEEILELETLLARLAQLAKECFDWSKLLPLLKGEKRREGKRTIEPLSKKRIGIARDRAFNFYYQDNLDLLIDLGAELIEWSPIGDRDFPEEIEAIYLGGGFPEVFAAELTENRPMRDRLKQLIKKGMPTYAECGGLMYLCEEIIDFQGKSWEMLGILPTKAIMGQKLTLGYRQAVVEKDSWLVKKNETVWGHEFHRSQLSSSPKDPLWKLTSASKRSAMCFAAAQAIVAEGWQLFNLNASYLHLHFGKANFIPKRLLHPKK